MDSQLIHKLQTGTTLPYAWDAYPYQERAVARYFGSDGQAPQTRQIHVWSRRLGKDRFAMELAALASQRRVMNIWHLFPLHKQARVAIWNGIDPMSGARFLDQTFPADMILRRSDAQMMLEFCNGSTYQMLGSDNYNSVVGSNPGLVIFSEYALSDPLAWTYISPIIRANNGGAVFISTFRGRNHHHRLVSLVKEDPEWYVSYENVETAKRANGSYVFPRADAEKELVHMAPARWREEYLNEPSVTLDGAYFANELARIQSQDRTGGNAAIDPEAGIGCAWGFAHSHHVWAVLFQIDKDGVSIVGARHWEFTEPAVAREALEASFPFDIDCHALPESAFHGIPGETIAEKFEESNSKHVHVALGIDIHSGIDAGRKALRSSWFGVDNGAPEFFEALTTFRSGAAFIDEDNQVASTRPVNDSGAVAAMALTVLSDFKASGQKIRRDTCPLDWSKRNIRRQFA